MMSLVRHAKKKIAHSTASTCGRRTNGPKAFNEIPGPRPLPLIGNIWRYVPPFGDFDITKMHVNAMKMRREFGPLVREKVVGDRVVVHAFDPHDMETIFRNEGRYPTRLSHRALLRYRKERPDQYRTSGLFPSNGVDWAEFRHKFRDPLLRQGNMEVYRNSLFEIADEMVKKLKHNDPSSDLTPLLYKWALEVTGVLALDTRLGCIASSEDPTKRQNQLIRAAAETHNVIMLTENGLPFWKFCNTPVYNKLVNAQDKMAEIVQHYLSEVAVGQTSKPEPRTVLQQFLTLPGDRRDVYTMILDFFLAGIDTTAYAMCFLLYHLSTNPNAQKRLRAELVKVNERSSGQPSLRDLEACSYLRACTRESHRLLPVALGTGRILDCDVVLSGHQVPAGTMLVVHNQVASKDPEQFSNPLHFSPERWLRSESSSNSLSREYHPFACLPFGYGPRMCIGRRFAESVINVLTHKIVTEYTLKYQHDKPMDCFTRLINVPDQPLKLSLETIEQN